MMVRASLVLALAIVPAVAAAQSSVSGAAEWTVAQSDNTTDTQANHTGAFWQNYAIGYHSSLFDPRLIKYDTEVSFRTNRLSARSTDRADEHGRQGDLGFRLGAFVLPAGAFPFFVQASRVFAGASGELALANPGRGGLALPAGAAASGFDTEQRDLSLGGRLNAPGLPQAEVTYRRGHAIVTGGAEHAEQRNDDLSAGVTRETPRTRQALRYQRTGYDYALAQAFTQQVNNLDYDFSARLWERVQVTARVGQRGTFAQSALLTVPLTEGDEPYAPPPTDGQSDSRYVTGGVSYEPNTRVAVRLHGTFDEQSSQLASTSAGLATGSFHAGLIPGLAVDAAATAGQRGQVIEDAPTQVDTASGVVGVTYSGGPRWLSATVTANTGQGVNETPEGERGDTRSWAREASVSSTIGWFGTGAGYERVMNRDAILDYGNYDSERVRASLTLQTARLSLSGTADRTDITRGDGLTLTRNRQDTFSATLSGRLWREIMVTGTAGGFTSAYLSAVGRGIDKAIFWGVGAQYAAGRVFRASAWIRSEDSLATSTHFDQQTLSGLARLEYRLRTINFAVEYRHNDSRLQYGEAPVPSLFRGHQFRISLSRQFGFVL
jgi:hypothetical protein